MFDQIPDSYSKAGVSIFTPTDREVIVPLLYFWDFYVSAGDRSSYSTDMLALPAIKVTYKSNNNEDYENLLIDLIDFSIMETIMGPIMESIIELKF